MLKLDIINTVVPEYLKDCASTYKGVECNGINYPINDYNEDHPIFEAYLKYEEIENEQLYISNIEVAREICDTYNQYYPNEKRIIIELTEGLEPPQMEGTFLGYDVASIKGKSNIIYLFNFGPPKKHFTQDIPYLNKNSDRIKFYKLMRLLAQVFIPKLNENLLFTNFQDAQDLLVIMDGVFDTFENTDLFSNYEVQGIYWVK